MGSYADHLFGSYASPSLMKHRGDEYMATYEMGTVLIRDIEVIIGDIEKINVFDDEGNRLKRTLLTLTVSTDKFGPYGGIPQPQAKGIWTVLGAKWAVNDADGEGTREITPNWFTISLVRLEPTAKSAVGYRN